jgi:hypothetical protein
MCFYGSIFLWFKTERTLRMKTAAFVIGITILLSNPATAYWSGSPLENNPIIVVPGSNQNGAQMCSDGAGGAIIVWIDEQLGWDIYAQRIHNTGELLWDPNGLPVCTEASSQSNAAVISDGVGGAFIVWQDRRNDSYPKTDIYAQRVDPDGDTLWAADGIPVAIDTNWQSLPRIVGDGYGGAVITWVDERNGSDDIYAQHVDADGDTIWAASGIPICAVDYSQEQEQIAHAGGGDVIIVWKDGRTGTDYDLYAQKVDYYGDTLWAADGVPVCTTAQWQMAPQIIPDGDGGAIIVWHDYRSEIQWEIYAQRVDGDGNALWTTDGVPICTIAAGGGYYPRIVSDGAGGAIIAWEDWRNGGEGDIYAQRVDADGDTLWPANGVPVCTAAQDQSDPNLVSDGAGGAIIAWTDQRRGAPDVDIYAQRIDASGQMQWALDGVPVCVAENDRHSPQMVSDGAEGAIIAWNDERNLPQGAESEWDIYAQQVNFNGTLGPVPRIESIDDVPDDQGRQAVILWERSHLDKPEYQSILYYSIWRKYPEGSKIESTGREWDGTMLKELTPGIYRRVERTDEDGQEKTEFWELIGTQEAHLLEGYAYIAPTLSDSSAGDDAYYSFFVSAHAGGPFPCWDSAPDSGYSVDDINPAKTQIGIIASGSAKGAVSTVWLSWDQVTTGVDGSPEQGPIDYRIYCAEAPDFTPAPGNLLTTVSALSYPHTDSRIGDPAANLFYLVTAMDGSGNESAVSNRVGEFDKSLENVK